MEHFKEYFSAIGGKSPYHPLHEDVKDTKREELGLGNSKIGMGNS